MKKIFYFMGLRRFIGLNKKSCICRKKLYRVPEFRNDLSRYAKRSPRAAWLYGSKPFELSFPYRFACGKLAKVSVSWEVLWTERSVLRSKGKVAAL
jgi:hypothetical protein